MTIRKNSGNPTFQAVELNYNDLQPHTQYFFAEYEIQLALPILKNTYLHGDLQSVAKTILILTKHEFPLEELHDFYHSCFHARFGYLSKQQLAEYMLFRNISYKKIREIAGLSPNTVAKVRFNYPDYFPMFRHWTPEMLIRWNAIARTLNLFNETLIHCPPNTNLKVK